MCFYRKNLRKKESFLWDEGRILHHLLYSLGREKATKEFLDINGPCVTIISMLWDFPVAKGRSLESLGTHNEEESKG